MDNIDKEELYASPDEYEGSGADWDKGDPVSVVVSMASLIALVGVLAWMQP